MADINGLLAKNRPEGELEGEKGRFAKEMDPIKQLSEIVKKVQPNVGHH